MGKRYEKTQSLVMIREGFILSPSYSQERLLRRDCALPQAEDRSKFRDLGKGENLNQLFIKNHFVLIYS